MLRASHQTIHPANSKPQLVHTLHAALSPVLPKAGPRITRCTAMSATPDDSQGGSRTRGPRDVDDRQLDELSLPQDVLEELSYEEGEPQVPGVPESDYWSGDVDKSDKRGFILREDIPAVTSSPAPSSGPNDEQGRGSSTEPPTAAPSEPPPCHGAQEVRSAVRTDPDAVTGDCVGLAEEDTEIGGRERRRRGGYYS